MTFFPWDPQKLSVRHDGMDDQHQTLVGYVNEFYDACGRDASRHELQAILAKVIKFTGYHFAAEEALMERSGVPGVEFRKHKAIHKRLVDRVLQLEADLRAGKPVEDDIKFFLKTWLQAHIQGIDRSYSSYVSRRKAS